MISDKRMPIHLRCLILCISASLFFSCIDEENNYLKGDWSVLDSNASYAEFYITDSVVQIYHELTGVIPDQIYEIREDTLIMSQSAYKMKWLNADSLVLENDLIEIKLKRIKSGFKYGDISNNKDLQIYKKSFWDRYTRYKGSLPFKTDTGSFQEVKEEFIDIGQSK